MTEIEAIKWQKQIGEVFKGFPLDIEEKMNDSCDMAMQALEKQIPKKTILQRSYEKSLYKCPCCDSIFVEAYENMQRGYIPKFCEMCGQSISFRLE